MALIPSPLGRIPTVARRATLSRAVGLFKDVTVEQTRPEVFYSHLAADTAQLIEGLVTDLTGGGLGGLSILDVGGGPGYFATEFESRGATYVALEPDVGEMAAAGITVARSVRGDGQQLPFRDNSFDVVYSSNVAEHVPHPWTMGEEMLRVTKPGGVVVLSYTVWLGPFGGHETGLWQHYLGGHFARRRYEKKHGHPPKNEFGTSLFPVSCAQGLSWGRQHNALFFPRYHPRWAWWVTAVPLLREFLTSNLVVVIVKR